MRPASRRGGSAICFASAFPLGAQGTSFYAQAVDILGINHVTFATTNLERAFRFYVEVLGAAPKARWDRGAFLTLGGVWLALLEGKTEEPDEDAYSHLAFSIAKASFAAAEQALDDAGVRRWSENSTPGDSVYFLDPDGHRLELHASDLSARLEALEKAPPSGYRRF